MIEPKVLLDAGGVAALGGVGLMVFRSTARDLIRSAFRERRASPFIPLFILLAFTLAVVAIGAAVYVNIHTEARGANSSSNPPDSEKPAYCITVTVLDPNGIAVDDAAIIPSVAATATKASPYTWEIRLELDKKPADGRIKVRAQIADTQVGEATLILDKNFNQSTTINLVNVAKPQADPKVNARARERKKKNERETVVEADAKPKGDTLGASNGQEPRGAIDGRAPNTLVAKVSVTGQVTADASIPAGVAPAPLHEETSSGPTAAPGLAFPAPAEITHDPPRPNPPAAGQTIKVVLEDVGLPHTAKEVFSKLQEDAACFDKQTFMIDKSGQPDLTIRCLDNQDLSATCQEGPSVTIAFYSRGSLVMGRPFNIGIDEKPATVASRVCSFLKSQVSKVRERIGKE